MGRTGTTKKRLEKYKRGYSRHLLWWQSSDPEALVTAAKFFERRIDDPKEREILLRILADALFGTRKGRPKGSKTAWPGHRLLELAHLYQIKKYENPKLSDTKIAKLICKEKEFKHDDPEQIRQRLGLARQTHDEWLDFVRDEAAADSAAERREKEEQYEITDDDY